MMLHSEDHRYVIKITSTYGDLTKLLKIFMILKKPLKDFPHAYIRRKLYKIFKYVHPFDVKSQRINLEGMDFTIIDKDIVKIRGIPGNALYKCICEANHKTALGKSGELYNSYKLGEYVIYDCFPRNKGEYTLKEGSIVYLYHDWMVIKQDDIFFFDPCGDYPNKDILDNVRYDQNTYLYYLKSPVKIGFTTHHPRGKEILLKTIKKEKGKEKEKEMILLVSDETFQPVYRFFNVNLTNSCSIL